MSDENLTTLADLVTRDPDPPLWEEGDRLVLRDGMWERDADSLDAAWAEAEAALPEGRLLDGVYRDVTWMGDLTGKWVALVHDQERGEGLDGIGDTPAAALRALAAKLRERQP